MEFLTPLIGLYAAAAAVPLLLLLYFLKLKRQEMLVSSTLLWKRAVQDLQVNAPFQKLRRNLLLLLQLLALAAILLALAGPVLALRRRARAAIRPADRPLGQHERHRRQAHAGSMPPRGRPRPSSNRCGAARLVLLAGSVRSRDGDRLRPACRRGVQFHVGQAAAHDPHRRHRAGRRDLPAGRGRHGGPGLCAVLRRRGSRRSCREIRATGAVQRRADQRPGGHRGRRR